MDRMSIFGFISAFLVLILGISAKGSSPLVLVDPAALIIIFGGLTSALMISFPTSEIKKLPTLIRLIMTNQSTLSEKELLHDFVEWSHIVGKEGAIGLQDAAENVDYPFLQKGFELLLSGIEPEELESTLFTDIDNMKERHKGLISIFTQAGAIAPTLGVLGAVMGLISALGNLDDMDALGPSIAAAFVATLFGIFIGYVIMIPFATKLKRKSEQEAQTNEFIIQGLINLQENVRASKMENRLFPYLTSKEQEIYEKEKEQKRG